MAAATVAVMAAVMAMTTLVVAPAGAQPQVTTPGSTSSTSAPAADLRVDGAVEAGPPPQGIDTGDAIRYRVTVRNVGPEAIAAGGLLLVVSVDRAEGGGSIAMEVARFNDGGRLRPAQGGACGIGTRQILQCTNQQGLEVEGTIDLVIEHRHPTPEAGSLSFSAQASVVSAAVSDPNVGNNTYRGPSYRFTVQPSTTTTVATSTSLDSSSTSEPDESTSSTEATVAETTTTLATTTTSAATTTTLAPTTVLESMTDDSASLVGTQSTLDQELGTGQADGDQELLLAPAGEESGGGGGPSILLFGMLGALVLMAGGVALALYVRMTESPPLVDIRRFE